MGLALIPRRAAATVIRGYQLFLSPLLPPSCRFTPSCSQYALEAVPRHGALRGSWLAARRLARCHPFHPGGFDPVPCSGDLIHGPPYHRGDTADDGYRGRAGSVLEEAERVFDARR